MSKPISRIHEIAWWEKVGVYVERVLCLGKALLYLPRFTLTSSAKVGNMVGK